MKNLTEDKKRQMYQSEINRLKKEEDAWYVIAHAKFAAGDKDGQKNAYAEIDAIQVMRDAMVDPDEDEILTGDEGLLIFDN